MVYFVPTQSDGKPITMPWLFYGYKFNFLWPLKANTTLLIRILNLIGLCFNVLFYMLTILGEFTFMVENIDNIAKVADCLSTSFMGIQYILRIFARIKRRQQLHRLMVNFYKDIYFTCTDNPLLHKRIHQKMRYVGFFTKIYYTAMVALIALYVWDVARIGLRSHAKPFIYRMSFRWYDAQVPSAFLITGMYSGWLTISTVILWAAEDYFLCLVLCHLSYRYKELRMDLHRLLEVAQSDVNCCMDVGGGEVGERRDLHEAFRHRLYDIFRRQQHLNW